MTCPGCDYAAAYHAEAGRSLISLFGPIRYERAYYYCRRCGKGYHPFDTQAGIPAHQLTPAAERLASLAGGVSPSFEKGAELLQEMSGVALSESTVERTTEDVGRSIAGLLAREVTFGPRVDWPWQQDARGRTVAYVSIDATGTRQQGRKGCRAEGRMAYVGSIFNPAPNEELVQPVPNRPRAALQARYLSGLYALPDMGPLLRRLGERVGMERAEVWVALTDGGSGLEDFVQKNFNRPDLVVILDFYHAASLPGEAGQGAAPAGRGGVGGTGGAVVQPAEGRGGCGDVGGAADLGMAGAGVGGAAGAAGGGAGLLRQ